MLSNIPRSKENQTIKLGQLKEYNTVSVFLEKAEKLSPKKLLPDFFLKNQN